MTHKSPLLIISILILAFVLRLISLDQYPAGINADEAAIGYNAYSLLTTGMDEHGDSWPLVFRSFDDYKPPLYFYLVLPFVHFFGLNVWSVRLPSAILGGLTILLVYLFLNRVSKSRQNADTPFFPEVVALLLAISPWHLHFSRGGWEVNAALFFMFAAVYFLNLARSRIGYLYLSAIMSVFSMYTYHSMRVVTPLILLSFLVFYRKTLYKALVENVKTLILAVLMATILVSPLIGQMLSKEGQSRFSGVSVFSDPGPLWQALERRRAYPEDTLAVKLIHNQYLSYGLRFAENYMSHFSPRFLFVDGDEIARSRVPDFGQSYIILAPFFFLGLYFMFAARSAWSRFVLFWFFLSPLPASLTFQSPHALRAHNMVIPLTIIIAYGLVQLISRIKNKLLCYSSSAVIGVLLVLYFVFYSHSYYNHYPKELPYAWQYGFEDIASYISESYDQYDTFVITDRYDQPYILMAFYLKYPPESLQAQMNMEPRDKFGFSTLCKFDKFVFKTIEYQIDIQTPNALIISSMDEPVDDTRVIDTIYDPSGLPMYKIVSSSL
jgi:4-amino-4-deoxy-L-arabinose transferase-like glycosyltransferase